MTEVSACELKEAVQSQLKCKAWFKQVVPVHETFDDKPAWDGVVHVFHLDYNGDVTLAYAWSSELPWGNRRFFVVEHKPPIASPRDAVRAAIVAEHRIENT